MTIDPAGREYCNWDLTDAPVDAVIEVSIDDGATWHATTREADTITVLVAGPEATDNPVGTMVAALGRNKVIVRAVDNPEIVLRKAGTIDVYKT